MTEKHSSHITWTCDNCGSEISDGAGVLGVPFVQLSNWPDTEPTWRPLHNACIDPSRDVYGLDIETVRTPVGLLKWTAHLIEKPWIGDTNWAGILRTAVAADGT